MEISPDDRENWLIMVDRPKKIEITDPNDWEPVNNRSKIYVKIFQILWFSIKLCIILIPLLFFTFIVWVTLGKTGVKMLWGIMKYAGSDKSKEAKKQRIKEFQEYMRYGRNN